MPDDSTAPITPDEYAEHRARGDAAMREQRARQLAHRPGQPIRTTAEFPFGWKLEPDDAQIVLGSDLALWVKYAGTVNDGGTHRARWEVWAINSDGEALGQLAATYRQPDGAVLVMLADLARRAFPNHAQLTQSDSATD